MALVAGRRVVAVPRAVVVLVVHMPDVAANANVALAATDAELKALGGDFAHPAIGLVILVVVQVLNIYKPRGLTRRGHDRRTGKSQVA